MVRFPAPGSAPVAVVKRETGKGWLSPGPPLPALPWALHGAYRVRRQEEMDERCKVGRFCFKGKMTENHCHLSRGTGSGVQSPGHSPATQSACDPERAG